MDNTEMHYLTYDPDAVWQEMLAAYIEAGGSLLYPGDEKYMLLRSVQADIVQVFAGVDNALRMQTLRYAVGEYLDALGEQRGCTRIQASKAKATVTITANVTGSRSVLEAGTAMTADGEVYYLLTADVTLTGFEQTVSAEIEADRAGVAGNGLLAGTQMSLARSNAGVSAITVLTDAAGGNTAEDDDTYRERIRTFMTAGVTTGPAGQYEAAAKAVSSEITDAKAVKLAAGQVGVYLILASQTGAAALVQAVEDALNDQDRRPLTDTVTVAQAEDVEYTLRVMYQASSAAGTFDKLWEAVEAYEDWQNNTVGRAFNPDRLMSALYQAGATRVAWAEGSEFDGGEVAYTEILNSQRCKGEVGLIHVEVWPDA